MKNIIVLIILSCNTLLSYANNDYLFEYQIDKVDTNKVIDYDCFIFLNNEPAHIDSIFIDSLEARLTLPLEYREYIEFGYRDRLSYVAKFFGNNAQDVVTFFFTYDKVQNITRKPGIFWGYLVDSTANIIYSIDGKDLSLDREKLASLDFTKVIEIQLIRDFRLESYNKELIENFALFLITTKE